MESRSAVSTQEISEWVQQANREYQLAKQELESYLETVNALQDFPAGTGGIEGLSILYRLAVRERCALQAVAEALHTLYKQNERLVEPDHRSRCA